MTQDKITSVIKQNWLYSSSTFYKGVDFYLVGTLELLLVKIKVSTESPHSKQRAQESRFVSNQSGTIGVLLVLCLKFCKSSYKYANRKSNPKKQLLYWVLLLNWDESSRYVNISYHSNGWNKPKQTCSCVWPCLQQHQDSSHSAVQPEK